MNGSPTSAFSRPDFKPVDTDLNDLVSQSLARVEDVPHVELTREFGPLPRILADREQLSSVVANLVLNARDATCGERAQG